MSDYKLYERAGQIVDAAKDTVFKDICAILAPCLSQDKRDELIGLMFDEEAGHTAGKLLSVEPVRRVVDEFLYRIGTYDALVLISAFEAYLLAIDRSALSESDKQMLWRVAEKLLDEIDLDREDRAYRIARLLCVLLKIVPSNIDGTAFVRSVAARITSDAGRLLLLRELLDCCPEIIERDIEGLCKLLCCRSRIEFLVNLATTCRASEEKAVSLIVDTLTDMSKCCTDLLNNSSSASLICWQLIDVAGASFRNARLLWPYIIRLMRNVKTSDFATMLFWLNVPVDETCIDSFLDVVEAVFIKASAEGALTWQRQQS